MKRRIILTGLILLPVLLLTAQDHVIISEIVLQPSKAEYIKLYNPTDNAIDLSNYYLTDGTDPSNQKYYYNLPTDSNFWSTNSSDFIVRFPQGYSIGAQSELIIAATTTADYQDYYRSAPDLAVKDDLLNALNGQDTKGGASAYLDNAAETLVLFYWDGSLPTVKDVDYVIWGNRSCAVDKSGVSGYLNDTPIAEQTYMPTHQDGQKLQRVSDEGFEPTSGGNGITGHNETGENLAATWQVVAVGNTKPKLSNITYSPANPLVGQSITFSVNATDDGLIEAVRLIYTFQSETNTVPMSLISGNTYSVTIGPFSVANTLYYQIEAEDESGLITTSNRNMIKIQSPPETLTIKTIRDNWDEYNGQTVTLRGVVTIGSNILITSRTSAYFQDVSGKGLNLYASAITNLMQGDSIEVTGELTEYNGVKELTNWTGSYTVLASNVPIKSTAKVYISELVNNLTEWEGSYVEIHGTVAERSNPTATNQGCNVVIEDETARTTVRIWNTTGALYNALGEIVNEYTDSLLTLNNKVTVRGVVGIYSNAPQILLGYASDVEPYIVGEAGEGRTKISAAPYPFVPKLGEVIKFTYEYPANCRTIVRVYDLSGRFITTLVDSYFAVSWKRDDTWNGRNELNQLVPPGNYILHLQTTNRSTGKSSVSIAPVVVGVKF
ncbi:MAG TPA: lamin tail domain-containing protein [Candidatus Marinimicrobia bacterium]|nr:lamin tail domain-containing protein [Candidatus Neomarinimicrobiota bacterium]HRS51575.1 lamin tail domain-containing protein [Candidatus Neomarinimicrobiota bacterium]